MKQQYNYFIDKNFIVLLSNLSIFEVVIQIKINPYIKYIITKDNNKIAGVYLSNKVMIEYIGCDNKKEIKLKDIIDSEDFNLIDKQVLEKKLDCLQESTINVLIDKTENPVGIIKNSDIIKQQIKKMEDANDKLNFYQKIVECIEEEILITDKNGFIKFLNPEAERVCGVKSKEVINKHVNYLEKEKIISKNITGEVIRTKKKVNILQQLKNGKTVLGTAVPIFDENNNVMYVICTSKNVKEINNIMKKIEEKEKELEDKNKKIDRLKNSMFIKNDFVFKSKKMEIIRDLILRIAPTNVTVMVQGETGVGKEVVTRLIHNFSQRSDYSLIKINCGLIPENLLESELFGYESGAFTGAINDGKIGKIELAHKGTLFLDEIGEMPLKLQVKLLDFLQDREITRVGGTKKIKIDTRVIVATNRNLKAMVKSGKFRQDLYYRLNVLPINISPLRDRKSDIIALTDFFLEKLNNKYNMNKKLDAEVINAFKNHDWPGNVRELMHVLERLILTSSSDVIGIDKLSGILNQELEDVSYKVICNGIFSLKAAKRELESQMVTRAYEKYQSTYKAAKVLQVDQSTVVRLLKKYR